MFLPRGVLRKGTPSCVCGRDPLAASAALGSTAVNLVDAPAHFVDVPTLTAVRWDPPPFLAF